MPRIVYCTANGAASTSDGIPVRLIEGEPWDADDPFVRSHPGVFSDTPPAPRFPRRSQAVEQATAAPGERRGARRG